MENMDTKQLLQDMGRRITLRRRELKLTQEQLADQMNVSTQMISYLESGRKAIRPENLVKLCSVLQITADYILTGKSVECPLPGLFQKLSALPPSQYKIVENILGSCLELADYTHKD